MYDIGSIGFFFRFLSALLQVTWVLSLTSPIFQVCKKDLLAVNHCRAIYRFLIRRDLNQYLDQDHFI